MPTLPPSSSQKPRSQKLFWACMLSDSSEEASLARIVRLAAEALNVPTAALGFIDGERIRYQATVGLDATECPSSSSICTAVLQHEGLTTFQDIASKASFSDHPVLAQPYTPAFVAGLPLRIEAPFSFLDGPTPVGALWVADKTPRSLSPSQVTVLQDLQAMVTEELERRASGWRESIPFEHMSDAYCAFDDEWRFTYLNRRAEQLLEVSATSALGRILWEVFPSVQGTRMEKKAREAADRQAPTSYETYYRPLGKWLSAHFYPFEDGLSVYFNDVTRHTERKELIRSINANVSEGLFRSTPTDGLVYVNQAFAELFGYESPTALLEVDASTLYADPEQRAQLRRVLNEEGSLRGTEIEFQRKDGSTFWGLTSSSVVYDEEGRPRYYDGAVVDITERKERKEWLHLLERALDNAAEAVMVVERTPDDDTAARIAYVNAAFSDLMGYAPNDVIGKPPHLLEGPATDPEVLMPVRSTDTSSPSDTETVNYGADGEPIRVHWNLAPVRKENGRPSSWVAVLHNVTERRRMEQELRARERKVEALYAAMGELLRADSPDQVAAHIENLVIDTLGYPLNAIRFVEDDQLVPTRVSSKLTDHVPERPIYDIDGDSVVAEVFRSGKTHTFDDIRTVQDSFDRGDARGTVYVPLGTYGLISMACLDPGAPDSFDVRLLEVLASNAAVVLERIEREGRQRRTIDRINTLRDISRSILSASSAQEVAYAALQRLTTLLPTLRASVTQFDTEEETATILAVDNVDAGSLSVGQEIPIAHFLQDDGSLLRQVRYRSAFNPESTDPVEQHLYDAGIRSGLNVPLRAEDTIIGALNLGASEPEAFQDRHVEIASEVADLLAVALRQARYREELIEAKEEAEKMNRLKSAFLANMSHEIRTPLTSIIGFAEVLNDHDLGEAKRFAELIEQSGTQLLETINSVLDLSKLEAGSMQPTFKEIELTERVEETIPLFQTRAEEVGIDFHVHLPNSPLHATLDQGALQRILHNLLSNAIKFTEAGGTVTLHVSSTETDIVLKITDTGVGIDPDFVPDLFEAFNQESTGTMRTHEGTGLGLTVTKELVDLLHGSIDVDSTKGEGTCFTVRLPRQPDTSNAQCDVRGNAQ